MTTDSRDTFSMLNTQSARAQARLAGATHYMGERACSACGGRKRYASNGACVSCVAADATRRAQDPEKAARMKAQAAERMRRYAERQKAKRSAGLPAAPAKPSTTKQRTAQPAADFADILG